MILSSLHHPNVVSFYGIVRDGPDGSLATVTEFMVNGSLKQFLRKKDRYHFCSWSWITSDCRSMHAEFEGFHYLPNLETVY